VGKKRGEETQDLATLLGALQYPATQILALYIPEKDRRGKPIKRKRTWVRQGMKVLSIIGGGATAYPPGDGTWLAPEKREEINDLDELRDSDLVWEKTTYVYTYVDVDSFLRNAHHLRRFLHEFGRETDQGEVVFEFDEHLFRIREYNSPRA